MGEGQNARWHEMILDFIEQAKRRKDADDGIRYQADGSTGYQEERLRCALIDDELLATDKFAEELDRQNVSKQEKPGRIVKFYKRLRRQNADKHKRLERKLQYARHLGWIKDQIKRGDKKPALGRPILEGKVKTLNSMSDRLLSILFTYEEMRLWLQTKPGIAAKLNLDLSHEVAPGDLREMLAAALYVGTFIPTDTAARFVRLAEQMRTAKGRAGNLSKSRAMLAKVPGLVKKFRGGHRYWWTKQEVADCVVLELKDPKTGKMPTADYIKKTSEFRKTWDECTTEHVSASPKK